MKYTVVWIGTAERALTDLWLKSAERTAVTRAAQAIDFALQTNPETVGESREHGQRLTFAPPLGVIYSVHHADKLVRVLRVWAIRRRNA